MDRRKFLVAVSSGGLATQVPAVPASTWGEFWAQPRVLWLTRKSAGEELRVEYWREGGLNPTAYLQLCRFLRDIHTGDAVYIDPKLLDLLFVVHGFQVTSGSFGAIDITNAYESDVTNRRLVVTAGAARNSRHRSGQAVDIANRFDSERLARFMQMYGAGGVGHYPATRHLHIDTGPARWWQRRALP